jgi:aromatic ring-opening dioxygenase LigB subunit
MIIGAAVLPTAPLLVPGVSATLPGGVPKVADAIDAAVEALPAADLVVLVAAGEGGLHDTPNASLEGVGRPDIAADVEVDSQAVARLSATTQYPMFRDHGLPLALTVLALHVGDGAPVVPLTVPQTAEFQALVGLGASIARTFADPQVRVVVVVAGDLSAGLAPKSPLHEVNGAIFWDEQAVAAVDSGRLDALAKLGPGKAQRVGALGWAPLVVLHGAVASAKLGMVVRHYSAPRGVGYLVASGA